MSQPNINQKPSQRGVAPEKTKPIIAPKPQIKNFLSLSKRGEFKTNDIAWTLRSHKNEIYKKYGILEKEVDKFADNLKKYDTNRGGYLVPSESAKLEKPLENKSKFHGGTTEGKWLKILSDPEIFNK